jgi:hypothetical protein
VAHPSRTVVSFGFNLLTLVFPLLPTVALIVAWLIARRSGAP